MWRYLGILGFCMCLSGCTTAPAYTPPSVGPQAKLRIVSHTDANTFLKERLGPECVRNAAREIAILGPKVNTFADRGADRRVGVPLDAGAPTKQWTEVVIPAGQPFALELASSRITGISISPGIVVGNRAPMNYVSGASLNYAWCVRILTFVPKAGAFYEAVYGVTASPSGDHGCTATLYRIEPSASGSYRRIPETAFQVAAGRCDPFNGL